MEDPKDRDAWSLSAGENHTGRVRVPGGELEYDVFGRLKYGGPAPLIFLHGWTLDRRMWEPQSAAFAGRSVVLLDRRGCGESSAPYDLSLEADDVIAVADHLGFDAFVLVGMSQAGQVAAEVALAHPSRLAALVLQGVRLGPVAESGQPDIPLDAYRDMARSGRLDAMKSLWRDHPLMRPVDPGRQAAIDAMLARYDGSDLLDHTRPRHALAWDALSRLTTPTLVVAGDRETPLRREVAAQLSDALAGATQLEIETAGHMCNMCAPTAYNAGLCAFLERL